MDAPPAAPYLIQPFACLIGAMPSHDAPVEFEDLRLQHPQLRTGSGETLARNLRHTIIIRISHNIEQFLDAVAPHRRYDAELGKIRRDGIDDGILLAHK